MQQPAPGTWVQARIGSNWRAPPLFGAWPPDLCLWASSFLGLKGEPSSLRLVAEPPQAPCGGGRPYHRRHRGGRKSSKKRTHRPRLLPGAPPRAPSLTLCPPPRPGARPAHTPRRPPTCPPRLRPAARTPRTPPTASAGASTSSRGERALETACTFPSRALPRALRAPGALSPRTIARPLCAAPALAGAGRPCRRSVAQSTHPPRLSCALSPPTTPAPVHPRSHRLWLLADEIQARGPSRLPSPLPAAAPALSLPPLGARGLKHTAPLTPLSPTPPHAHAPQGLWSSLPFGGVDDECWRPTYSESLFRRLTNADSYCAPPPPSRRAAVPRRARSTSAAPPSRRRRRRRRPPGDPQPHG